MNMIYDQIKDVLFLARLLSGSCPLNTVKQGHIRKKPFKVFETATSKKTQQIPWLQVQKMQITTLF